MRPSTTNETSPTSKSKSSQVGKEETDTRALWKKRKSKSAQQEVRTDTGTQWKMKRSKSSHHAVQTLKIIPRNDATHTNIQPMNKKLLRTAEARHLERTRIPKEKHNE